MVSKADRKTEGKEKKEVVSLDEYRENVRKTMLDEVQQSIDADLAKAALELREEQSKAIEIIVQEQKAAIRQIVEEEKQSIWEKAEKLEQSIWKMGI